MLPSHSILAVALLAVSSMALTGQALAQTVPPAGAATPSPNAESKALHEQISATGRRGFLIEATRAGRKLFIYGGATASRQEFFPLNLPLMQSLGQSTALLLDVNPTNSKAFAQAVEESGTLPADINLDKLIPAEMALRLRTVAASLKINPASYQRSKPWLVALALRQQFAAANGYDVGQNSALYVLGYAQGAKLPIIEIEGAQGQLRLLSGMSAEAQTQFLDQSLKSITSGQERKKLQLLVDEGWARGNHIPVDQANALEMNGGPAFAAYAAFHSRVWLAARSQRMADAIERAMESTHVPMVALPASSVIGQSALLSEFVKRGFALKDVQQ